MKTLRTGWSRLAGMFSREQREREFFNELQGHLEMHIDDNMRAGMSAEEARRDAMLKLGGAEKTKQAYRERGTVPFFETLMQDLRFAARQLWKNPGFTVTAVLMLGLGIAASVSLFAFVDAVLLKPLPYADPNRLVDVTESVPWFPHALLSYPDYVDWKRMNRSFSSLDVYGATGYLLKTEAGAEPVEGERVTDGFFRTLGVSPLLGRDFYSGEDLASAPRAVILSYSAWQKRFSGRGDIVGQSVSLSGLLYDVVGVMPASFEFAPRDNAEFWTAMHADASNGCDLDRKCHGLLGVGRLKDGVSIQAALADMTAIAQQLERQYPDDNQLQGASVLPLSQEIVGSLRKILLVLLTGAILLLLIACVNICSLLLVRSESRRREIAVRGALGASPLRLGRQFITEAVLLVFGSTALGVGAAYLASRILLRLIPKNIVAEHMPYLRGLGINLHVLCFAGVIAALATAIFSVIPILRLSFSEMRDGLTEGSRGSAGLLWRRIGANLTVLELAIAVVLLVSAGLLNKSFYHLLHVDLNFRPDHLATLSVAMPPTTYAKNEQIVAAHRLILERVAALPGVVSATTTSLLPVSGNGYSAQLRVAGIDFKGKQEVNQRYVSANYFTTLKTRLLEGRLFAANEDGTKPKVVVVNQAFVKKYFPGHDDPLGKRVGDDKLSPESMTEIVGVVDDLHEATLDGETLPTAYYPADQSPDVNFNVVVRTLQDEKTTLPVIVSTIHQVDPGIGTADESTMLQHINDSQTAYLHRSSAWLVGGFAGLALLLGTMGLYGVIAYSVGQRTREIGVRMALGAQREAVQGMVLREGGRLAALGIGCGLVCSLGLTMLLRSMLFGVQAWDVGTMALVAVVLAAAAMLASYLPARRAASINPVEALRAE